MSNDAIGILAKQKLPILRTSRFGASLYYPTLGPSFGRWPFGAQTLASDVRDTFYTVNPGEAFRLDLLAYNIYGSTFLWWVLALANNIRNPFTQPAAGDILRIPDSTRVFGMLQVM